MNKDSKISSKQIKGLVVTAIIGVGILSLPSQLANIVGLDGWIPLVIAGLIMVAMITMIVKIFEYSPGLDIFEISRATLGPVLSTIYQMVFAAYFIILLAFVSRTLTEVIRAFLLVETPIEVIMFTFILVISYIARCEIDVIGRLGYLIYPIILAFILFLVLVTFPTADFTNLLPMFQSDIKSLPNGFMAAIISYGSFEILLFAIPYAEDKKEVFKASLYAIGLVTVIYVAIFLLTASLFGLEQLKRFPWATLSLVKEIDFPGLFLENLDGIVTTLWVLVVSGTMAPGYFSLGKILANLFKTKSHELFILPLIPIIYTIALVPQDYIQLKVKMGNIANILSIIAIFFFPTLIFIISYFKDRRSNN